MNEMVMVANESELARPTEELRFWTPLRRKEYERLQSRKEDHRLAKALGYRPSRRA